MVNKKIFSIIIICGIIISIPIIYLFLTNKKTSSSSSDDDDDGVIPITIPDPLAPGRLNVSTFFSNEAELFWIDNSVNETGFRIERSTSKDGPFTQIGLATVNSTFYRDTGLDDSTNYFYRVRAYKDSWKSGYSNKANSITNAKPDKFGIQEAHYSFHGDEMVAYGYPVTNIADAYQMLDNLDDLAIKNFRYSIYSVIEGLTDPPFNWTQHDILIPYLYNKGLNISICLQGYEDDPPFDTEHGLNDWLWFVSNVTDRYSDMVNTYEIWNEPDCWNETKTGGQYWKPLPNPWNFTMLVNETAKRIRSIQPEAIIITGGLTSMPDHRQFLIDCLDYNIHDNVDGIGIHPYRIKKPEGPFDIDYEGKTYLQGDNFTDQINNLTLLIKSYKPSLELWSTECGYINFSVYGNDGYHAQAKFLSRTILLEHAAGLKGITHFRLRSPPAGWDSMFLGIVDKDTFERYQAFKAFESISKCFGSSSVKYEKTLVNQGSGNNITMQIYSKNGLPIIAYWFAENIDNDVKNFANVDFFIDDILGNKFSFKDILSDNPSEQISAVKNLNGFDFFDLPISDYPHILYTE